MKNRGGLATNSLTVITLESQDLDRIFPPRNCYEKVMKLRDSGGSSTAFEITIPREIVERYARKKEILEEEAAEKLKARIRYGGRDGILVKLERRDEDASR